MVVDFSIPIHLTKSHELKLRIKLYKQIKKQNIHSVVESATHGIFHKTHHILGYKYTTFKSTKLGFFFCHKIYFGHILSSAQTFPGTFPPSYTANFMLFFPSPFLRKRKKEKKLKSSKLKKKIRLKILKQNSRHTTVGFVQCNIDKTRGKESKITFINFLEVFKEGINKSIKNL